MTPLLIHSLIVKEIKPLLISAYVGIYPKTHNIFFFEVGVYLNSTTLLLDKLDLEMYLKFKNYSDIDQHVSTGQSLHQDLFVSLLVKELDIKQTRTSVK